MYVDLAACCFIQTSTNSAYTTTVQQHRIEMSSVASDVAVNVFNNKGAEDAFDILYDICRSREWADKMVNARPFENVANLLSVAEEHFRALSGEEWLKAFAAHPKLGDRTAPAREAKEQSGTASASEIQLELLANLNTEYYDKNGFVFLLCATGVSIEDMLTHIQCRVENSKEIEMSIAAEEKLKIIFIRLNKLLAGLSSS